MVNKVETGTAYTSFERLGQRGSATGLEGCEHYLNLQERLQTVRLQ